MRPSPSFPPPPPLSPHLSPHNLKSAIFPFGHAKSQMRPSPLSPSPSPLTTPSFSPPHTTPGPPPSIAEVENTRFLHTQKKTGYGRTDGRTDRRTDPHIQMRGRI